MFVCLVVGVATASSYYKQLTIGIVGRDWVPMQTYHFCAIVGIATVAGLGIIAFLRGTTGDTGTRGLARVLGAASGVLCAIAFVSVAIALSSAYEDRLPLLAGSLFASNLVWTTGWTASMAPGELKVAILNGLQAIQSGAVN